MNKWIGCGRLVRDPDIKYSQGTNAMAVARYTLAVDRRFKKEGEPNADFINCVAFGKSAEFAEKFFKQGTKIVVCGRIQTGSYTNKEGQKVYTTDIMIEEQEFAESKSSGSGNSSQQTSRPEPSQASGDGFVNIADDSMEDLPFN